MDDSDYASSKTERPNEYLKKRYSSKKQSKGVKGVVKNEMTNKTAEIPVADDRIPILRTPLGIYLFMK